MNIGISTQRKINAFFGRKPYEMFGSQAELEAAYKTWREHVDAEDEARYQKAVKTAGWYARVVTSTWQLGRFHLRRGDVVYVKAYPERLMVTRTDGSMRGMVGASNWPDINAHTMLVKNARRELDEQSNV